MKYLIIIFFLLYITINAQSNFKKGKIQKINNEYIEAYIGLYNWQYFPDVLKYKYENNSQLKTINSSDIKAVYINDGETYIKNSVKVDVSSNRLNKLDNKYQANFQDKTIFLKLLVKGTANLYFYLTDEKPVFFYETKKQELEQLVYKKYYINETQIGYNMTYLSQLSKNVNCNTNNNPKVNYSINSLTKYFVNYNKCKSNDNSYVYTNKKNKFVFNIKALLGVDYTNIKVDNKAAFHSNTLEFKNKISPRFGFEIEGFIPSKNKNYFTVFLTSTYKQYQVKQIIRTVNFDIKYTGLDLTPGLRYFINLSEDKNIFIDAGLTINFTLSQSLKSDAFKPLDTFSLFDSSKPNFVIGTGYNYNKLNLFLKYYFPISFEGEYIISNGVASANGDNFKTNMETISLQFAYTIF